jgi:hypothetical protein
MALEEQETMITINQADKKEGFFKYATSRKCDYEKLLRRVKGKENLIEVNESKNREGEITFYTCKVPLKYLSPSSYGVRKEVKIDLKRSEAAKARGFGKRKE